MQLKEVIPPNAKSIQSKIIAKSDAFKVNKITLKKGAIIKEHTTPIPAFLLVQKGQITFNYRDKKISLSAEEFLVIKANEVHWVVAEIDSELLLVK